MTKMQIIAKTVLTVLGIHIVLALWSNADWIRPTQAILNDMERPGLKCADIPSPRYFSDCDCARRCAVLSMSSLASANEP